MKPYRLINASELQALNQHFSQVVADWNEEYALMPLSLQLSLPQKDYKVLKTLRLQEPSDDLAMVSGDYLTVLNYALFNCDKPCFHATSQKLGLSLLGALCQSELCTLQQNIGKVPDWFYAGSTSLLLSLSCTQSHFSLALNPNWVYQQLPQQKTLATLDSVDEALAKHTLKLGVELLPSKLSIKNLAGMQVGDILTTNHPLSTPLNLTRNNELLAQAELGHSAHHKSIVLKRSS